MVLAARRRAGAASFEEPTVLSRHGSGARVASRGHSDGRTHRTLTRRAQPGHRPLLRVSERTPALPHPTPRTVKEVPRNVAPSIGALGALTGLRLDGDAVNAVAHRSEGRGQLQIEQALGEGQRGVGRSAVRVMDHRAGGRRPSGGRR